MTLKTRLAKLEVQQPETCSYRVHLVATRNGQKFILDKNGEELPEDEYYRRYPDERPKPGAKTYYITGESPTDDL